MPEKNESDKSFKKSDENHTKKTRNANSFKKDKPSKEDYKKQNNENKKFGDKNFAGKIMAE